MTVVRIMVSRGSSPGNAQLLTVVHVSRYTSFEGTLSSRVIAVKMAATSAIATGTCEDEAYKQATTSTAGRVEYLVKKLRAVSSSSQKELENVNDYLSKLEVDKGQPEQNDPIMAFDLENLKQAIRETITVSGRYMAACKSMEHYLLNLETYCNGAKATVDHIQDSIVTSKSFPDEHEIKSLLNFVHRCITRCCTHVDEYGHKYKGLNDFLGVIIDKYCVVSPSLVEERALKSDCCSIEWLFNKPDDQNSEKPPLHAKLNILKNAQTLAVSVVKHSENVKRELLDLENMETDVEPRSDTSSVQGEKSVAFQDEFHSANT